ncbi:MAG TPA: sialate O-acetylesterase [Phycisphaerae bacterium]|jgi:hypothetical protein
MKFQFILVLLTVFFSFSSKAFAADPDPKFYIFLAFGQSNMEGFPGIPAEETNIDKLENRFQVLAAVDFPALNRKKETWSPAVPPLCRPGCGMCPADYFGRTLVANLPKDIKVGIVNVSVAGCKIEMFEKDTYKTYASTAASWMQNIVKQYDGNPYQRLIDLGKLAQKDGVIKGILLHQGESNSGDKQWPTKVKGVYDNIIKDLDLKADKTPLLIGELTNGGGAAMIAEAAKVIPNSYVISSKGCPTVPGNTIHFAPAGYRILGTRYGEKMLDILGVPYKKSEPESADTPSGASATAPATAPTPTNGL